MKALYIPLLVLAGMLCFALWTGSYVERHTAEWQTMLSLADDLAQQEQWEKAEDQIQNSYADWNQSQAFFHTIMEHEELDEAESLFATAFAACDERDVPDFHAALAALLSKLSLLAETQQVSIQNIL